MRPKTLSQVPPAKTLPQAIPGKTPSSTLGSQANRQARSASALHPRSSPVPKANARKQMHDKQQTSKTVASKVSAGKIPLSRIVDHQSPLVGNRVDFNHKIEYDKQNNRSEMACKLKQLTELSSWRSIRGKHMRCCTVCPAVLANVTCSQALHACA